MLVQFLLVRCRGGVANTAARGRRSPSARLLGGAVRGRRAPDPPGAGIVRPQAARTGPRRGTTAAVGVRGFGRRPRPGYDGPESDTLGPGHRHSPTRPPTRPRATRPGDGVGGRGGVVFPPQDTTSPKGDTACTAWGAWPTRPPRLGVRPPKRSATRSSLANAAARPGATRRCRGGCRDAEPAALGGCEAAGGRFKTAAEDGRAGCQRAHPATA
jgi:hypothetical protein